MRIKKTRQDLEGNGMRSFSLLHKFYYNDVNLYDGFMGKFSLGKWNFHVLTDVIFQYFIVFRHYHPESNKYVFKRIDFDFLFLETLYRNCKGGGF